MNNQAFRNRTIVPERGMEIEPPFADYIARAQWSDFVRQPAHPRDSDVTYEFYLNLVAKPSNTVFVKGLGVCITPRLINQFYGLPDYLMDDYRQLLATELDERDLML